MPLPARPEHSDATAPVGYEEFWAGWLPVEQPKVHADDWMVGLAIAIGITFIAASVVNRFWIRRKT